MDVENCTICSNPGDLVCFCSNSIYCSRCIGRHIILIKDLQMRTLLASSWKLITEKEKEILAESAHIFEIEKCAKERMQAELGSVDKFVNQSIKGVREFCSKLKSDIDRECQEIESNIVNLCESYKTKISSSALILEYIKSYSSKETIEKLDISNYFFSLGSVNISQMLKTAVKCDISMIQSEKSCEILLSQASSELEASPSIESPQFRRSRTRVSTKINKKGSTSSIYSSSEGFLNAYNIQIGEFSCTELEIDKLAVCTVTPEGSVAITGGFSSSAAYIFNTSTKLIQEVENMLSSRYHHAAVSLGDFVYVIGGRDTHPIKNCERFDLVHNNWQRIGELTTAREKHSACVYRGRIFVAGGDGMDTIEVYNTVLNKFTVLRTTLSAPGCCLMFAVEDFIIIFHERTVSTFDPAKFTCQHYSNLDEDDWYVNSNICVIGKLAYFIRHGLVYQYDTEEGVIAALANLI